MRIREFSDIDNYFIFVQHVVNYFLFTYIIIHYNHLEVSRHEKFFSLDHNHSFVYDLLRLNMPRFIEIDRMM